MAFDAAAALSLLVDEEVSDELASLYVGRARELILNRRHPFSDDPTSEDWEPRYNRLSAEIAAFLYVRRDAEGQTAQRENGIYRAWESGGVPKQLLAEVVPIAAVP